MSHARDGIKTLQKRLGLDLPLDQLERAFRHGSYVHEHPEGLESNERLEFLGDAVIELAAAEYLFRHFPLSEGELTRIKSIVVSGPVLAEKALELGLDRCLLLGRGEEESGGRQRHSILGDAFEALVGLIFEQKGYEAARALVIRHLQNEITRAAQGQRRDYKTLLQELAQRRGHKPVYTLLRAEGEDHRKRFTVRVEVAGRAATGQGRSKKEAEQAAAQSLHDQLERSPDAQASP